MFLWDVIVTVTGHRSYLNWTTEQQIIAWIKYIDDLT